MSTSLIERDALVGNLLDRVDELERRIRYLEDTHPGVGGEAAGKLAYYREDGSLHAPGEICPDGEPSWGIWARRVNLGITPTDHFRSGAIPIGLTWNVDAPFNGAPAILDYSHQGTYLETGTASGPNLLCTHPVVGYIDKLMIGRFTTGVMTEIGLRIDDGSDDNYAMMLLDPDNIGAYNVDFRHRVGGGAPTDTPGPLMLAGQFYAFVLLWYNATPAVYGYLIGEHGGLVSLAGFNTAALAWTPHRAGIYLAGDNGSAGFCDWFYSTFT